MMTKPRRTSDADRAEAQRVLDTTREQREHADRERRQGHRSGDTNHDEN